MQMKRSRTSSLRRLSMKLRELSPSDSTSRQDPVVGPQTPSTPSETTEEFMSISFDSPMSSRSRRSSRSSSILATSPGTATAAPTQTRPRSGSGRSQKSAAKIGSGWNYTSTVSDLPREDSLPSLRMDIPGDSRAMSQTSQDPISPASIAGKDSLEESIELRAHEFATELKADEIAQKILAKVEADRHAGWSI